MILSDNFYTKDLSLKSTFSPGKINFAIETYLSSLKEELLDIDKTLSRDPSKHESMIRFK